MIKTAVVTGFGINADYELQTAFEMAGAKAPLIHIKDLIHSPQRIKDFQIIAFPGGFSFGDHIGSGKVFGSLFKLKLKDVLQEHVEAGKLVIGICNGFQVLVKMGILPNLENDWKQEVSLVHNDSGVFEDRWVRASFNSKCQSPWISGLTEMDLPVRHGEGKFVVGSDAIARALEEKNMIALQYMNADGSSPVEYPANPNGSYKNIAGICDPTGRVLGLMPHPEAFIQRENHPLWQRRDIKSGEGLAFFEKGVSFFK
ncbi:MAG: phosphoribosylformylglycinamidine synthase subunit PurQ [Spirochaetales bacterium]|nr:phosphoribosylformylglycinamidine synthase subunit PurQ [Spirochaetales bacterium]